MVKFFIRTIMAMGAFYLFSELNLITLRDGLGIGNFVIMGVVSALSRVIFIWIITIIGLLTIGLGLGLGLFFTPLVWLMTGLQIIRILSMLTEYYVISTNWFGIIAMSIVIMAIGTFSPSYKRTKTTNGGTEVTTSTFKM